MVSLRVECQTAPSIFGMLGLFSSLSHLVNSNLSLLVRRSESALSRAAGHKSAVLDMAFHVTQANVLASASASGEVFVWDITNPQAPTFANDHQQGSPSTSAMCALDWNWKVFHLDSSASFEPFC